MKNIRVDFSIAPWAGLFLLIALQGCSNKDSELERSLTKRLIQHKTDSVTSIDLREIFGSQWKKACLQSAYTLQTHFEKMVGENVKNYKGFPDNRYALWVFYTDGHTSRVEIEIMRVMDYRGGGTGCTSFQQPYLYFNVIDGEKKYFFNDTRELK